MNKRKTLIATACFASVCGAMNGQTSEKTASFQYFVNGGEGGPMNTNFRVESLGGKIVRDKPFSGSEERRTVQVLGDGTRIDKKETDKYYRDNQGRTRVERDNGQTVVITDPLAGVSTEMSAGSKTARKLMVMRSDTMAAAGAAVAQMGHPMIVTMDRAGPDSAVPGKVEKMKAEMEARTVSIATGATATATIGKSFVQKVDAEKAATEDLGSQIINGVSAQGTRSTITIPAGQIGNDREIKVVSERWFSPDLQMLIRSSNKDPRFGETTYELLNVLQGAQDPTLFQIPADVTVNNLK